MRCVNQPTKTAVYTPDPVLDIARAIAVSWRHNPRPEQLLALIDHFDGDHILPRTLSGNSELEVTCLFLRLAGVAVTVDPKALLVTAPDGSGLDVAVAAASRWLLEQVADAPQMLVARPAAQHATPSKVRLERAGVTSPAATAESQSAVWAGLAGAAKVAAVTEACRQVWAGPHPELLIGVADDVASATIAVFCPPWATSAAAALPSPRAPQRLGGTGVGLAYLIESGMTAGNPWAHQWAVEQLAAAVDADTGTGLFLGSDRVWVAELAMVAACLDGAYPDMSARLRADMNAAVLPGPVAYFAAGAPSRRSTQLSAWTEASVTAYELGNVVA